MIDGVVSDAERRLIFLGGDDGTLGVLVDRPPLALVCRSVAQLLAADLLRAFDLTTIVPLTALVVAQLFAGFSRVPLATVEAVWRMIIGDDVVADFDKLEHRVLGVRALVNCPPGETDAALLGLIIVADVVIG